MKAYIASLQNALILIAFGLWGYFGSDTPSFTSLIPVAIGFILLLLNPGVRKENKIIAHVAVVLTVLVLGGLAKPMIGAMGRSDIAAELRVGFMILSTLVALGIFVKSFIDARKNIEE